MVTKLTASTIQREGLSFTNVILVRLCPEYCHCREKRLDTTSFLVIVGKVMVTVNLVQAKPI